MESLIRKVDMQMPPALFVMSVIGLAGGSILGELISPSLTSFGAIFGFISLAFVGFQEDKVKALFEQKAHLEKDYDSHLFNVEEQLLQLSKNNSFLTEELTRLRIEMVELENQLASKGQTQGSEMSNIAWRQKPIIPKEFKSLPLVSDFSEIHSAAYVEHTRGYLEYINKTNRRALDPKREYLLNKIKADLDICLVLINWHGKQIKIFDLKLPDISEIFDAYGKGYSNNAIFYRWTKGSVFNNNPFWSVKYSDYQNFKTGQLAQLNIIKSLFEKRSDQGLIDLTGEE